MRLAAPFLAVLALAASGCGGGGGGGEAGDVLRETADKLGEIRSGEITLELTFEAKGLGRAGFALEGPVDLDAEPLPVARLEVTQFAGERTDEVVFLSTGEKAYVEVGGETYVLPPELVEEVRGAVGELEAEGGLEQIELDGWIVDPQLSEGPAVAGAATDRITAKLDVVNVVNGLLDIAGELGGAPRGTPRVEDENAERLRQSVRNTRIVVLMGKEDRLLRRLELAIDFSPSSPDEVQRVLGTGVRFLLEVREPNSDVSVPEPEDARPYSELSASAS
jgi:hypothetical protein